MRSFLEYLNETVLMEANVANGQAIDAYVAAWMKKTPLAQGKAWLKKKLRTFLLNEPKYLSQIDPENRPDEIPDYAVQALDRGEAVYLFDPAGKVSELNQPLQHIIDWFDAMNRTIEAGPDDMNDMATEDFRLTQKEVEKLQKVNMDQITATADAWFNHMGTRLRGVKKEVSGAEIIHTWPDGFYVVRYTEAQTMKMDGRDLQNCLQHGNYWDAVRTGRNQVFGIRKPNDEAVVGMRTSKIRKGTAEHGSAEWELEECKGKANKPPIQQYIPYVIDFLKMMDNIDIEGSSDLEAAGVFFRDGTFGSFDDISELVFEGNGIVIRRSD
ncbi:MAG: hypothetical protein EOP83_29395, partial [Verrucomicrobiaceae bacterium]